MSYKFEEGKDLIIDSVVKKIAQKMSGAQASLCAEFVRQFFGTVALDDLQEWSIDDLYGAAINFWSLIQSRAPGETKIRIYNPDYERHGWQTTHTVVEIIAKDMPFLVDSIRMVVNRMGLASHLIIHMGGLRVIRNEKNIITDILPQQGKLPKEAEVDAPIFMEIDRQTDPSMLEELYRNFERVLEDNRVVVEDWLPMREKVRSIIDELENAPDKLDPSEVEETKAFLHWIEDHHFTFLGIRDYELIQKGKETILQAIPETGLGVLRPNLSKSSARSISAMTPEARELTLSPRILVMSKTNTLASVHRDAYTDYIGVKRFNKQGQVIGERRIIGLYTSAAYNTNPKHIPFLRHKVALIMKNSNLNPRSHAGKVLLNILETLPRDDLIQATEDELLEIAMGIFHMQERKRIRMFARMDVYRRFISCLVYVPRDRFNTELREAMQEVLSESFNAQEITFSTRFSESVLARIHFIVRINPKDTTEFNFKEIEKKLIEVGRSWTDELQQHLYEALGEEEANRIYARYKDAFPAVYMANFSPRTAVFDIKHVEQLSDENSLGMNFYRPLDKFTGEFKLKIYQQNTIIPLSDALPIIENLGMRAISERPYALKFDDNKEIWINDFALQYTHACEFNFDEIKDLFQNAFTRVWFGDAENDGFNQLVLGAGLDWRQVSVLRTYAKYFKQIGFTFSQDYIISALNNNSLLAKKLVQLFELQFNPIMIDERQQKTHALVGEILTDLDNVANLDEDKIIRQYIQAITSTLRTNYYQLDAEGQHKNYISIKLNCKTIAGVPRPYPMFEIFVYSPKFEGVHLRGGKVARGGIRWSDRKEDFRTEILGLMKAQQVKNAVIVPSGAKGGFVTKQLPANGSREEILAEGINCYKAFIRGLLDITDNYKDGEVIKPTNVICYDEDDTYLVVAADKGTATFSDIANEISLSYNFWLGDAFASGGSVGYDHKKMGITAKGAWESVKRHFYEMGKDIQSTDFTVVGIGDMAGDVFGNGMLLSKHIKLVAAFNHMHIFIDPDPNPEESYKERERLFHLPRSTWADYDKKLISKGGGVFNRSAKSIVVSKEMKRVFGIKQAAVEPNELIRIILQAEVDLLWSAGIGTFVKAHTESNLDVGDRSNDAIRINAKQLRCKVVGEGGNLGFTQLGRVEYALNGGLIYTDFIDNSAGVSCSDKEVNIKILLNTIVRAGDLTQKQRNELLMQMTEEVEKLVLRENYLQTRAISLMASQSMRSVVLHSRYINELEATGKLDRSLEFLPEEKTLMERKQMGMGLTSPGIAVLFCYSKILLKEAILASDVPEDPYLRQFLIRSFPKPLQERFSKQMRQHPLKREIIATKLSNIIVNEMGFTFIYRLQDETGAPVSAIVRAYMIARSVINMEAIWQEIDTVEGQVNAEVQTEIMMNYVRLLRRISRWFLRNRRTKLDISKTVELYAPGIEEFKKCMPQVLGDNARAHYEETYQRYLDLGISKFLAHELTITQGLFAAMDIIEVAHQLSMPITKVAEVYFKIGEFLDISWIRTQVIIHPTENHWEVLSREALRDDLDWQQRQLTAGIIHYDCRKKDLGKCLQTWSENHAALIDRWRDVLANLRSTSGLNYTMFFVAIRELLDLTQTTIQMVEKKPQLVEA
ncbi:NAD-glutamate dehydrogenase [Legionella londiniensis]|uniref:NAD-glutamate dehydrogenase n=1 Tax=Legionella londiniensis TaxID=45068 RepID=A0A0W0VLX4_9GAMM|nr:NAD-glutamate dehydrogenase [Legionella londiniensis]KTD21152.1 NAD-glutamate dehydrogenase [Legionella londiniensis]STX93174.1 NAD-glutamate dehydrogenase [Legionella londiniensis]